METLYPQMIENYKKYRSIADDLIDELGHTVEDKPNLFVPYPYAIVESELPRLAGKLPRVRIFPSRGSDIDKNKIELRQNHIYYMLDRCGFLRTQIQWIRQYLIYGWSPLYYFWRMENVNVLSKEPNPQTGEVQLIKKRIPRYDDFWARVLDVFDCYIQPGALDITQGDWFMFREWLSAADLKRLAEEGIFYPEVAEYLAENSSPSISEGNTNGRGERDSLAGFTKEASEHAYGKYELMWTLEDERLIAMLDRKVLAMAGDNPHPLQTKPVLNCNLCELVSEPIGIGTIESLAGLPDKLNTLTNARLEDISLKLGKTFLANRNANIDWENFVMGGGNIIFTDDTSEAAVKELETSDTPLASEREVLTSKEEMQFVTGTSDFIVGVKSGSRLSDTATGVSTIVREANARYNLKQVAFEVTALRDLVKAADAYASLYVTDERRIYVQGPEGYLIQSVTPEDLAWDASIIVEPGSTIPLDQITRRESLMQLLDRVMKSPNVVDIAKYWRELLEAFDFRNVDELVLQKKSLSAMDQMKIAQGENIAMRQLQEIDVVGDNEVHYRVHLEEMQKPEFAEWPAGAKQMLQVHADTHKNLILEAQRAAFLSLQSAAGGQAAPGGMVPPGGMAQPGQGQPPGANAQPGGGPGFPPQGRPAPRPAQAGPAPGPPAQAGR